MLTTWNTAIVERSARTTKPTHGGKREGAGRKPAQFPERLKKFRATDEEWAKFLSMLSDTNARWDFEIVMMALELFEERKSNLQSIMREKHKNDR